MFGFRYWHPDDRAALDDSLWDAMKHAIDAKGG
jgi:hypothetical protein